MTRRKACCLPEILWGVRFNRQGAKKQLFTDSIAMVYCQCSYVAPLVPGCYTPLAPFFLFIYLIASPLAYRLIVSKPKADGT